MPLDRDEQDNIREQFAGDPRAGQVEQAAAERAALAEHDQDTAGPDKRLEGFGYKTQAQQAEERKAAAEKRREAAKKDDGGKDDKGPAPAKTGARDRSTRGS
jgi:hypothetical protein